MPAILNHILSLIAKCSSLNSLKQSHAHIITHGLCSNNLVAVKLVSISSQILGHIGYARTIFDSLSSSANVYLWTAMISSYSHQSSPLARVAVVMYRMMLNHRIPPNNFTMSTVLKACSTLKASVEGKQIHTHSAKLGFSSSIFVQTALLDMYSKLGDVEEASRLFDSMAEKNVVACNAMIACRVRARDTESARQIFDQMSQRDAVSVATMMTGYAGSGDTMAARELLDQMHAEDVECWNALIAGYYQGGEWDRSVKLLNEMLLNSVRPNHATMAVLISSCGQLGALRAGMQLHGFLHKITMNVYVNNSLVSMYAKCGGMNEAYNVFVDMPERDLVSYNAMITGLANHGLVEDVLNMFRKVLERGVGPDAITFLGILTACSQNGLVDLGLHYFERMRSYAVEPSADHYACIVDLFGRAGSVEKAYGVVKSMPVEPHAGVWGALLNACRCYGHIRIGGISAGELFRIERENPGNYVLLSNIYASASLWGGVRETRGLMRGSLGVKAAGCSWIELKDGVFEFVMGDEENPKSRKFMMF
ncbi:putative pentatricopeptide repeat-containing protein [Platanthera guangdongensis]|uniref:Pentatricopeptide repeat-containing protein n=1 Tax=Platanthera guangdongensis TaxID=2320717 RepID=A0ABR2LF41_9ASPA